MNPSFSHQDLLEEIALKRIIKEQQAEMGNNIRDYILQNSAGNLYWKDTKGRYQGCNDAFAKLNKKSPSEIIGKTDRELFLSLMGENNIKKVEHLDRFVMENDVEKTVEEIGLDSQGQLAFYITRKLPLRNKSGEIIGIIGTSIDVTQEKQAELIRIL